RIGISFEDRLDRPVRTVADPAADAELSGLATRRVAEEHALDAPVHDHPPPDRLAHRPALLFSRWQTAGSPGLCARRGDIDDGARVGRGLGVWPPARRAAVPSGELP